MKAYFVPSVPTFIPEAWRNDGTYTEDRWPSDAVLLTEEETATYWMVTPPEGKKLGVVDGKPAWVDIPPPKPEELIAIADREKASLRLLADSEISWRQDAVDVGIATDEETLALAEWKKYRILLMRIDTSTAPEITWPEQPK